MKPDNEQPDVVTVSWPKDLGEGLESNLDRAFALVDDTDGKQPRMEVEILVFIRHPKLRSVARELMMGCAPSFSRASALRKLLEADEAMARAGAITLALAERQLDEEIEATKPVSES